MQAVDRDPRLKMSAKAVFRVLQQYEGTPVSYEEIAAHSRDKITVVQTAITNLAECGYVTITERAWRNGRRVGSVYKTHTPAADTAACHAA